MVRTRIAPSAWLVAVLLGLFTTSAFADVAPPRPIPPRPQPPRPEPPQTRAVQRDFVLTGLDRYEGTAFVLVLYRGGSFKASKLLNNDVPFEPFTRDQERNGVGQPSWRLFAVFSELPEKPEDITGEWLAAAETLSMGLGRQFKSYTWTTTERQIARERITYKISIVTDDDEEVKKLTIEREKRQLFNDDGDIIRTEEGAGDEDGDGDGLVTPDDDAGRLMDRDATAQPVSIVAIGSMVALGLLGLIGLVAVGRRSN